MPDIVITLPRHVEWEDYQKELDAVAGWSGVLNYRLPGLPSSDIRARQCYLVWRGFVRGWMRIIRADDHKGFRCMTTGKWRREGFYIQRSGPFHRIDPIPMRGFRGWRYFEMTEMR